MAHWYDAMQWSNPPDAVETSGAALTATTSLNTDFWRGTFYGFYHDDGHFLYKPVTGDFTAEVTFNARYQALYDQAGLMLRVSENCWVKAGIEYTDGAMHFSVVVTNENSDWSMVSLPKFQGDFTMRVTRHAEALRFQYKDALDKWRMVRLAHFPPVEWIEIGPMCCSPARAGFEVTFSNFTIGPPISRELHD